MELAELAAFCLEDGRGPYVWWQAGHYSGKSALLATFVLRPPEPVARRVQIVSFFITARLAAQDTREAFTQVLLEQLAEITGQELPAVLPEATREGYLLDLLAQAAAACQQAGGRLVLVVDGLDEDRGVTTGPYAHSIAGLLPADPPAGMRVIVAGRPNPPVPDDVPDWHPLHDPGIVRKLTGSAHARNIGRLARRELQRLLGGSPAEQDLLGLLTAAAGGLSSPDLGELTGIPLWEIETILHTTAGRTFARRSPRWEPATGPQVYLLDHDELRAEAVRYLARRLPDYWDRLHAWAQAYQARGWPPDTPEYLLGDYYSLLESLRDLPRMTACASDPARHNRLLALTGGDAAALAEIRAALDLVAAQDAPDLAAALALAWLRGQLNARNTHIPIRLPAVWATLGRTARAEALASSITDPGGQADALAWVAEVLAEAGQHQQAAEAAGRAEAAAQSITDPGEQADALAKVAVALAEAGQHQQAAEAAGRAEAAAQSITDPGEQADALAKVAVALAQAGQHQQAEAAARSITDPDRQTDALAKVAETSQELRCQAATSDWGVFSRWGQAVASS